MTETLCEHVWRDEIIVDAERCDSCGAMRLAGAEHVSVAGYDARVIADLDRALKTPRKR
jgi:hypothetical protein